MMVRANEYSVRRRDMYLVAIQLAMRPEVHISVSWSFDEKIDLYTQKSPLASRFGERWHFVGHNAGDSKNLLKFAQISY